MPKKSTTHVDSPGAVGRRLKEARLAAGLTQRQLSFPGCTAGYIARIEAGDRTPSLQLIRVLARRLGVSEEHLATGSQELPVSRALLLEADIALRLDDLARAEELLTKVEAEAETDLERAEAIAGLGQLAFREERPRLAIERFEAALALAPQVDTPSLADTLGRAHAMLGEHEAAIAVFRRHLARAEQAEDLIEIVRFSVLLANAYIDNFSFDDATSLLASALERMDEADPLARARIFWTQSRLHSMRGDAEAATRYAHRALEILELGEHSLYLVRAHHLLAFAELEAGHPERALEAIDRGREHLTHAGDGEHERAQLQIEEARALAALGRVEEAAELALTAAAAFRDAHPFDVGRSFAAVARAFDELGETARARELYELAIELLEQQPNRYLAEAYAALGGLYEREGRTEEALRIFKRAAGLQVELSRSHAHPA